MSDQLASSIRRLSVAANAVGMIALCLFATVAVTVTTLAAAGILPWLEVEAGFGGVAYANIGQILQIGITVLLLLLTVYLPSAHRVMRLENSHRRFEVGMRDVAQAYALAHATDREGVFTMSSEYDAVRERIIHLRNHPDLENLEPEILELAAQMSQVSKDLAETYSDAKVARAKSFLQARQQEVENLTARIDQAKQFTAELERWKSEVEVDESVAASQLKRLGDTLADILPELSQPETETSKGRVVALPRYAAE